MIFESQPPPTTGTHTRIEAFHNLDSLAMELGRGGKIYCRSLRFSTGFRLDYVSQECNSLQAGGSPSGDWARINSISL